MEGNNVESLGWILLSVIDDMDVAYSLEVYFEFWQVIHYDWLFYFKFLDYVMIISG